MRSFLVEDILGFDKSESSKDVGYDAEVNGHKRREIFRDEDDACTKYRGQGHRTEDSRDISREEMEWQG